MMPVIIGLFSALCGALVFVGSLLLFQRFLQNRTQRKLDELWRDPPPLVFKIFKPGIILFAEDARKVIKDETYESFRGRLFSAGMGYSILPEEYYLLKIFCAISGILFAVLYIYMSRPITQAEVMVGLFVGIGVFKYPDFWLKDRVNSRRKRFEKDFPFMLDLLVLAMRAGMTYSLALSHAVESLKPGPIKDEFSRVLREIRAGKSRAESLSDLARRVCIQSIENFVSAMVQAEETGGELINVLSTYAEQQRVERFNRAEELANKAPVKMLMPMMGLLFPVIFLLIGFLVLAGLADSNVLSPGLTNLLK